MRATLFKIIFTASMLAAVIGAAYKWVDDKGNVHYTDKPPEPEKTQEIVIDPGPSQEKVDEARQRTEKIKQTGEMLRQSREFTRLKEERKKQAALHEAQVGKAVQLAREFGGGWIAGSDMELQCQERYNMNCDDMLNWKTLAIEKCEQEHGTSSDCRNDYYLFKFKPVPIAEQRKIGIQRRARERRFHKK
jgi:hypothetical protein